jgi:hypothetical protein
LKDQYNDHQETAVSVNYQDDSKSSQQQFPQKPNNTGIPDDLKRFIEAASGVSLDEVRVFYNSEKPAEIGALAYAEGTNVYIGPGQEAHLEHELWHVVQQIQGRVKATTEINGKKVDGRKQMEDEADKGISKQTTKQEETEEAPKKLDTGIVQGKFGVEYETKWTINDPDNVSANHKKKVHQGNGFHIESDNNDLEFVSMPPSDTPRQLFETVGRMKTLAESMIGNLKGTISKPPEEHDPQEPLLKHNAEALLTAMNLGQDTATLEDVIKHVVRDEDQDKITAGHIDAFAQALISDSWVVNTPDAQTTVDTMKSEVWTVASDLRQYINIDYFDGIIKKMQAPAWEPNNLIKDVIGRDPEDQFDGKSLTVESGEQSMKARPQFTFGVDVAKIPDLFQMFIDGPTTQDQQRSLNYNSNAPQNLEDYSKASIGPGIREGNDKAKSIFESNAPVDLDNASKGFVHYLTYYINQMRTKAYASDNTTAESSRSTYIAQTIIEALKAKEVDKYPIDNDKYQAGIANIKLTAQDKEGVEAKLGKSLSTVIDVDKHVTEAQKTELESYYQTELTKMKDDPVYPKHFFVLMNRSGFDKIYDSLEQDQKPLVNTYVEQKVIPEFLEDQNDISLFTAPYYYKQKTGNGDHDYKRGLSFGPSVKEWWASIKDVDSRQTLAGDVKRDKLSPPQEFVDHNGVADETQSLGSLGMIDGGLTVIELRQWGNVMPAASWQQHTSDMLKAFVVNIQEQQPDFDQ